MLRGLDGYFRYPPPRRPTLRFSSSGVGRRSLAIFGGHSEGETPLPIPNRAVKPLRADGTWPSGAGESRSPPIYSHGPSRAVRPVVVAGAVYETVMRGALESLPCWPSPSS